MIVTCPECSTRYHVKPAALGGGRMVRCTKCAHTWMMVPPDALDDVAAALSAEGEPALSAMSPAAGAGATGRGLARVLWGVLVVAVAGVVLTTRPVGKVRGRKPALWDTEATQFGRDAAPGERYRFALYGPQGSNLRR